MIASIQWRAAFLALLPVTPVPLSPYLSGLAFSPRGVIHSHEILPLFFAVFAPPTGELAIATRLIQSVLLCHLSLNTPLYIWAFTCTLCLIRCLVGFTLTRSVGWAAPAWFSHYSLYEPLAGLGPGLYAYLTIIDNDLPEHLPPLLAVTFCWMENAPWTYGISILVANAVKLLLLVRVGGTALTKESPDATNVTTRSSGTTSATTPLFEDAGLPAPAVQQGEKSAQVAVAAYSPAKPTVSIAACTRYGLLPLLATLPYFLIPAARLPFPEDTSLEVLVLSFPRPIEVDLAAAMINTTINSFVPYLSPPSITMSVFTHSAQHEALRLVSNSHPHIAFHADQDSHSEDVNGHYLHLAEAFRWAGEKRRAEWYMLVEDDFPVCKGGWDVIVTVMNMLESQRADQSVDAGFIGTGGSGIIIHKSYLPLLSLLLRQYSALETPLPSSIRRRAPDQVIQDCIVGRWGSLCERERTGGKTVISSRIVLDHIGGMATTTKGKALNRDKWRCGWRHAFHGDEAVDVVVV